LDFESHDTEEQEAFRKAVRGWLDDNVPKNIRIPREPMPLPKETQTLVRQFRQEIGAKGWLAPTLPKKYGGGNLSPALAVVVHDELKKFPIPGIQNAPLWIPAILAWGTEQQKAKFVTPGLRGEIMTWQLFSEPRSGSDLASLSTQAEWDQNGYVITGEKGYVTGTFDPDYLTVLAVTDPQRPPPMGLGFFMVPAETNGITVTTKRLLVGTEWHVSLNQVRITHDCLIGGRYQGWEIAQTILERERGGFIFLVEEDETVKSISQYLKQERGPTQNLESNPLPD